MSNEAGNRMKYGPYLTIYNKDYIPRDISTDFKNKTEQEFKDPIKEGFRNYLHLDKEVLEPPDEDADEYCKRFTGDHIKVGEMMFQNPLNHDVIKTDVILDDKTVYQVDYCDIEEDIQRRLGHIKKETVLPPGWEIPLTTQRISYRNPRILVKGSLQPASMIKQLNNLGQDEKINEILDVKTGKSEYMSVIGKIGDFIVNEQIHGKIVHPDCTCTQHNTRKQN